MTNDYLNIDVPRGLPPQSKKPALLSLVSILAAYNAIVGDSQNAPQPTDAEPCRAVTPDVFNDPRYYGKKEPKNDD